MGLQSQPSVPLTPQMPPREMFINIVKGTRAGAVVDDLVAEGFKIKEKRSENVFYRSFGMPEEEYGRVLSELNIRVPGW